MPHYIYFNTTNVFLIESSTPLSHQATEKLTWVLQATPCQDACLSGHFIGPRKEMVSPWSTNACDILRNMGIPGILRAEIFEHFLACADSFDPMLQAEYHEISSSSLQVDLEPRPPFAVGDIAEFNDTAGLALSEDEIAFLEDQRRILEREFTDCELFAFAQINSEHCRHKIFNGKFIIDGVEQKTSLFGLIKETTARSGSKVVSAYKDNVAFLKGPPVCRFAPVDGSLPSLYQMGKLDSVISIKAETHNFPTTVEPFFGASTGTGGEIRDRLAGGQGGIPLVGTAVYMTAYPRVAGSFVHSMPRAPRARPWKYQSPEQILVKASNGASDFGNKFGQPLITGSVLTFEGESLHGFYGFDRCIMLGGGVGYTADSQARKLPAQPNDMVVLLGGDNYRIGMAGGSVSSVATGAYSRELELSAVQRANPEIQKRVYNAIRSLVELARNPIKIIHDHGAGGHVNCFSELLEELGGRIQIASLPLGDRTLSLREILCNESQERMGLIVSPEDVETLRAVCERERAPLYIVGVIDGSHAVTFEAADGSTPFAMPTNALFGAPPRTVIRDSSQDPTTEVVEPAAHFKDPAEFWQTLRQVFALESVGCKDWLTNKVDRCVTGHVAQQQCVGPLHLPLSNVGVAALDYVSQRGVATAIGSAPIIGILDERAGAVMSVARALTNIMWAPLDDGLSSVALSANWMWPCKQPGEDARLYRAVEALARFSIALGIPVPTGKDSLSMTMKYHDSLQVKAPGTVIVSAAAPVNKHVLTVTPDLVQRVDSSLVFIDFSGARQVRAPRLGASALAQTQHALGSSAPTVEDPHYFSQCFSLIQDWVCSGKILAGHDISNGGLITTICEMAFGGETGVHIRNLSVPALFSESPGAVIQVPQSELSAMCSSLSQRGIQYSTIGSVIPEKTIRFDLENMTTSCPLDELRKAWVEPSHRLDLLQTKPAQARERLETLGRFPLDYRFPKNFDGLLTTHGCRFDSQGDERLTAAVIREQGTNGERELAFALFAAGFKVRDVTMTDLLSGRESLTDVHFVGFPGGFANSDVLGSARGWAGSFKYNSRALDALTSFMRRPHTLSVGICNGCQLMVALDLLYPEHQKKMAMLHNRSGKFESAFIPLEINATKSIMLQPLIGTKLGIWVAHGEGRFSLPEGEHAYDIAARYVTSSYPANPNGSDYNAAAVCSADGRHLAVMPHLERSSLPWHWAHYPFDLKKTHQVSPWMLAFVAARHWIESRV